MTLYATLVVWSSPYPRLSNNTVQYSTNLVCTSQYPHRLHLINHARTHSSGLFLVVVTPGRIALEFHRLFDGRRHGFRQSGIGFRKRLALAVHAGGFRQLKVSVVIDDHGPVSIEFRLFGHDNGLLPGRQDGFVLGDGPLPVGGTRKAPQEYQWGVVKDQKGLQKEPKAGGEDTEQDRHRFSDPQSRRCEGPGVQRRQADSGHAPERRPEDREGKSGGLAEAVADHALDGI